MMNSPVRYTFLGFYLNSLVDEGNFLDLEETHQQIRNRTLFKWLKEKFDENIDLSIYSKTELDELQHLFENLSVSTDEERKMGVKKNGLCLLVAYCFQGLQQDKK